MIKITDTLELVTLGIAPDRCYIRNLACSGSGHVIKGYCLLYGINLISGSHSYSSEWLAGEPGYGCHSLLPDGVIKKFIFIAESLK